VRISDLKVKQVIFIHQFWTVRYFHFFCSRVTAGEQHSLPSLLLLLSGVNWGQKLGTEEKDETRVILKWNKTEFLSEPMKHKVLSYSVLLISKHCFSVGSQSLPICPDKSSMWGKLSREHWWNDSNRGKPKDSEKPVPLPIFPPKISHALMWSPRPQY